jgi:hypothetical protein
MRALLVVVVLILTLLHRLAAQPIHTSAASRFVLSSYHTHNDRYNVQLVSINADGTVVIVLGRMTLFQARPGQRFCVVSGEQCADFRLISADPQHQRAVLQAEKRHHTTTDRSRPNHALQRTAGNLNDSHLNQTASLGLESF